MHGPGRANLEGSSQTAQEQLAQPEETPPREAGKRAKACPDAISLAADWSGWTSMPASYSKKLDDRGADTRLNSPAPRTLFLMRPLLQDRNRTPASPAVADLSDCPIGTSRNHSAGMCRPLARRRSRYTLAGRHPATACNLSAAAGMQSRRHRSSWARAHLGTARSWM